MEIRVGSKRFEDEYRKKTKVMFSCSMKDKVEEKGKWPCGVCKKGLAVIQFCAMVARNGFTNDVVE